MAGRAASRARTNQRIAHIETMISDQYRTSIHSRVQENGKSRQSLLTCNRQAPVRKGINTTNRTPIVSSLLPQPGV